VLTSGTWYILRERYASWLHHDNPGAANWHKTLAIYQVPLV
jgi:hypothetical protein